MKKAIVLLLALAVLGGAAFAQDAFTVTGSATLTWGMDLNTMATGFLNAASFGIKFPIAAGVTKTTTGEGTYGEIVIDRIYLSVEDTLTTNGTLDDDNDATTPLSARVTAKIVSGPLYVMVYNRSSLTAVSKAAELSADAGDVASVIDANTYGTKIGITGDYAFALVLNSKGDWTTNTAGEYAVGVMSTLTLAEMVSVNLTFGYDVTDATKDMFIAGDIPLTFGALAVTPAFDVLFPEVGDLSFDAALNVAYDLTETTAVSLDVYYGADEDLETYFSFEEDGGYVEGLYASIGFGYYNFLEATFAAFWEFDLSLEYTVTLEGDNYMMPYAYFGTDTTEVLELEVGVEAGLIPNTTFTLDYTSTDLNADDGIITFATKITL